jgi:hypothetical protein
MKCSRWRAAGNEYLLAERTELGGPLTSERARAEVGSADGILEIVAVDGNEAEIVIWNPDGSPCNRSATGRGSQPGGCPSVAAKLRLPFAWEISW